MTAAFVYLTGLVTGLALAGCNQQIRKWHMDSNNIPGPFTSSTETIEKKMEDLDLLDADDDQKNLKTLLQSIRMDDQALFDKTMGNVGATVLNKRDDNGETVLFRVIRSNHLRMAQHIVENKLFHSINQGNINNLTPLGCTAFDNHLELFQLLLNRGAGESINRADFICNRTPLFWAVWHDNVEMVRIALKHGAADSTNMADSHGKTPWILANEHRNQTIVQLLQPHANAFTKKISA